MKKVYIIIGMSLVSALILIPNASAFLPLNNGGIIIISDILAGFCNIAAQGQLVFNCNGPNATLYLTHGNGITIHAFQNNQTLWFNGTGSVGPQGPAGAQGPPGANTLDTIQNTGGGQASIFKDNTTSTNFRFKTISVSGGGLGVTNGSSLITITSTALTAAIQTLNGNASAAQTIAGTTGHIKITDSGSTHTIDILFKINNGTCANGRFSSFDNKTGNFVCTGGTGGVASLNGFQGNLKLVPQVGNTTILNNTGVMTVGLGVNPVITGGATQTVTKQLITNSLKLGGNEDANSYKITNLNNATSPNDAVNARRLGLLGNMTYGNKCSDGQILQYQLSNQTWICKTNTAVASIAQSATYIVYKIGSGGSATYYELSGKYSNVVSSGSNATIIIQKALDDARATDTASGSVFVRNGTYSITGFISVPQAVYFQLDKGATLQVPSGYTGKLLKIVDKDFTQISGGTLGEAIPIQRLWTAISLETNTKGVYQDYIKDMTINDANVALELLDSGTGAPNTDFINGDSFENLWIVDPVVGINFTQTAPKTGSDGFHHLIFNNVQTQKIVPNPQPYGFKHIYGTALTFINCVVWDLNATAGETSADILTKTNETLIIGGSMTGANFVDNGNRTKILDPTATRLTFGPTSAKSGLNVGQLAGNPATINNGDIWYTTATNALGVKINGVVTQLVGLGLNNQWVAVQDFDSGTLRMWNPAKTNLNTIQASAVTGNRIFKLPLTTATDTFATLGLNQNFTAKNDFGFGNTKSENTTFSWAGITMRNPVGTFGMQILTPNITKNQTLTWPNGISNDIILSNSSKLMDLADVGGQPCSNGWILTRQTSNATWICAAPSAMSAITSINGNTTAAQLIIANSVQSNLTVIDTGNNHKIGLGQSVLVTNGTDQPVTKTTFTINNLKLGGQVNLNGNTFKSSNHVYSFLSNTGTICLANQTGTCGSNSGVTSITGTANNVTASSSTGAVTLNLGSNVVTTGLNPQTITKNITLNNPIFPNGKITSNGHVTHILPRVPYEWIVYENNTDGQFYEINATNAARYNNSRSDLVVQHCVDDANGRTWGNTCYVTASSYTNWLHTVNLKTDTELILDKGANIEVANGYAGAVFSMNDTNHVIIKGGILTEAGSPQRKWFGVVTVSAHAHGSYQNYIEDMRVHDPYTAFQIVNNSTASTSFVNDDFWLNNYALDPVRMFDFNMTVAYNSNNGFHHLTFINNVLENANKATLPTLYCFRNIGTGTIFSFINNDCEDLPASSVSANILGTANYTQIFGGKMTSTNFSDASKSLQITDNTYQFASLNQGYPQTFSNPITFTPNATRAGINIGSVAVSPTNLKNGDIWYLTTPALAVRLNGGTMRILTTGQGESISASETWTGASNLFTGSNNTMTHSNSIGFTSKVADSTHLLRGLTISNPAFTFGTQILNSAILHNRTLTLPVLTANGTVGIGGSYNSTTATNKTGTSSTSQVMYGSPLVTTLNGTGKTVVNVNGETQDSALSGGCRVELRYSTSFMGGNGVAATGTQIGANIDTNTASANQVNRFSDSWTIQLTKNTKYYFDVSFANNGASGTCTLSDVDWNVYELQ